MGVQNPNSLFYGFAIEYSIPYLQSEVRDIGLGPPFNRMIPLVEFALTSPFNRGYGGFQQAYRSCTPAAVERITGITP